MIRNLRLANITAKLIENIIEKKKTLKNNFNNNFIIRSIFIYFFWFLNSIRLKI